MKAVLLAFGIFSLITPCAFSDTVTLNSGEVMQGDIISETDTELIIAAVSHNRTITTRRSILKSDIKAVDREPAQQKQERRAFEALQDRLRLDPNQELSKTNYESGIVAFDNYLTTYPESKFAGDARKNLSLWRDELSHIERGEVKFMSRWMTPDEKKPLVEKFLQQQRAQKLSAELQSLQNNMKAYEMRQSELTNSIAATGKSMARCKDVLNNPQAGTPATAKAQQQWRSYETQLGQLQQQLTVVNNSINSTKLKLAQAEAEHEIAYAAAQQPLGSAAVDATQQVAVAVPQEAASPQPVSIPKPWVVRMWTGLAILGGILLVLAILAPPLLRRAERVRAERDKERRIAREHLKKIFDRIFVEGERPAGKNMPEGEVVSFGHGQDAVGGGRWFVIGPSYTWAVANNGREDDNWALNNVETGGPGAIGARVMTEAEVVNSIKSLAEAAS